MEQQNKIGPSAKIILDSISEWGQRLTTMEVVMHRFVLAEFNTHRVFSRNSASSRAIPYVKTRNKVATDPAMPVKWGAEQPGMQSGDELDHEFLRLSEQTWRVAMEKAVHGADLLTEWGLHKSLINRLIEPFMWHTVIVTSTEWDNFFWQRCHPDAQPEMKAAADEMQRAYFRSKPKVLCHGEWHCPYIDSKDKNEIYDTLIASGDGVGPNSVMNIAKQVSVARCARVSYLTHDGTRDIEKDVDLFEKLQGSGHWSPFEHVATPVHPTVRTFSNFHGWKQYRKEFLKENRTNFVPNLPDLIGENK